MTQATPALPAAAARRKPAAAGQASAVARFLKLLCAVLLLPLFGLMCIALFDLHFFTQIWQHGDSGATLPWRRLTQSLSGLTGLTLLGLSAGAYFQALTAPEGWLNRYGGRLLGGQAEPGAEGSFLVRWTLLQVPLSTLLTVGLSALLNFLQYPAAAAAVLCAAPLGYGLYLARLSRQLVWNSEICREDGTLFAWVSSAVAQLTWLAAGCVFFLQAKPLWHFTHEWFQAVAVRAVQFSRLIDR